MLRTECRVMRLFWMPVMLLLSWSSSVLFVKPTSGLAVLDRRSFTEVLVAISPDITSKTGTTLVPAIESLIVESSTVLHRALGLYVGQVTVLVPSTWDLSTEEWTTRERGVATVSETNASNMDIFVPTFDNLLFGKNPYAVQFGGCGTQGEKVVLPVGFVLDDPEAAPVLDKAKLLAKEWIKYRYGVFDEHGFAGDPMYPLFYKIPGTEGIRITDCANQEVVYQFQNTNGENCTLETNGFVPAKSSSCVAIPDPTNNDGVTSSLMWDSSLRHMQFLCGDTDHPHSSDVPTKQNILCKGQSVWSVLKQHNDFKYWMTEQPQTSLTRTSFRYVKIPTLRVVLAVDVSRTIKESMVVQNAVSNFIYSLPAGAEFGLLKFSDQSAVVVELQKIDISVESRNNLILKSQLVFNAESSTPEAAIDSAIQMLAPDSEQSYGSIVLVTSSSFTSANDGLKARLKTSKLCLHIVTLQLAAPESYYSLLDSAECGKITTIEEGQPIDALSDLYIALDSIVYGTSWNDNVLLKTVELRSDTEVVNFVIDKTIEAFEVWISSPEGNANLDEQNILLTATETGEYNTRKLITMPSFFALRVEKPKAAIWTVRMKVQNPLYVLRIITSAKSFNQLSLTVWIKDAVETIPTSMDRITPIIMYAKLYQGNHPITDALVTAKIKLPNNEKPIEFQLLDNGLGDPDITKYDGIYSRYFTQFSVAGVYEGSVTASDNMESAKIAKATSEVTGEHSCCGSAMTNFQAIPTGKFLREVKVSFKNERPYPQDGFSPSAILDFRVIDFVMPSTVVLNFSSPGGEKDSGTASSYLLKLFTSQQLSAADTCFSDSNIADYKLVDPAPYSTQQTQKVVLDDKLQREVSYFFAMCAKNNRGKFGDKSNIVEIFLTSIPETTTTTTPIDNNSKKKNGFVLGAMEKDLIIGITVSVVLIIIIAYAVFYFCVKRKNKKKEQPQSEVKASENHVPEVDVTSRTHNNNDGSVRAREWILDNHTISPVNSVPAQVLIEHHEQVKNAKRHNMQPPTFKLEDLEGSFRRAKPTLNDISEDVMPEESDLGVNYAYDENGSISMHDVYNDETLNDSSEFNHQLYALPLRKSTNV